MGSPTRLRGLTALTAVTVAASSYLATGAIAAADTETPGRTERVVENWGGIEVREITLDSPMLPAAGPHPPACDKISYLRYRLTDGPENPERADAVLVMQPGATGSAYSMDRVARNTLHDLAAQGKQAEWWSLARRGVCQQDDTGIEAARAAGDYRIAIDYYYNHKEIGGKQFPGWRGFWGDKMGADFGVAQTSQDENEILTRELPDQRFRQTKTLCGGHSQGGLLTGLFAATDFTGHREDAGYNQCAGFVALDTLVTADPVGLKVDPLFSQLSTLGLALPEAISTALLKFGLAPADNALIPIFNPQTFNALSILGLAAQFEPDAESDVLKRLPVTWGLDSTFRVGGANTWLDALTGANNLRDFRFTNRAAFGQLLSKNGMNIGLDQVSLGALAGGQVQEKTFPLPDGLQRIPLIGLGVGGVLGHEKRVGPVDPATLYTWDDYRHTPTTFYTDPSKEVVDIDDFARMVSGPLGFTEWYFPTRVLYDTFLALAGSRTGSLSNIKYNAEVMQKPMITINGTGSVVKDFLDAQDIAASIIPFAPHFQRVLVPNYTHIDTLAGAETQNDGSPDPVGVAIADFTDRTIG
ncbi:hypothetical protein ACIP5Y_28355 [Nocardia sp. NPDC088792]|uniref:hypothetical protein n=1 Tax=Nocardia sp. NPDC088792 TaxID=3364332 RepID=UPI003817F9B2